MFHSAVNSKAIIIFGEEEEENCSNYSYRRASFSHFINFSRFNLFLFSFFAIKWRGNGLMAAKYQNQITQTKRKTKWRTKRMWNWCAAYMRNNNFFFNLIFAPCHTRYSLFIWLRKWVESPLKYQPHSYQRPMLFHYIYCDLHMLTFLICFWFPLTRSFLIQMYFAT